MNENQRRVLIGAAIAVGLMLLFPPLILSSVDSGYGFLFSHRPYSVNIGLLFTQWVAVGVAAGVAWVLFRGKS